MTASKVEPGVDEGGGASASEPAASVEASGAACGRDVATHGWWDEDA
jgi:hypothetical protein